MLSFSMVVTTPHALLSKEGLSSPHDPHTHLAGITEYVAMEVYKPEFQARVKCSFSTPRIELSKLWIRRYSPESEDSKDEKPL
jgi:hypothetical protein